MKALTNCFLFPIVDLSIITLKFDTLHRCVRNSDEFNPPRPTHNLSAFVFLNLSHYNRKSIVFENFECIYSQLRYYIVLYVGSVYSKCTRTERSEFFYGVFRETYPLTTCNGLKSTASASR